MRITARVDDRNYLPNPSQEVNRLLSAVVRKAAFDIEGQGKVRAPVDTGYLRSTIRASVGGPGRLEAEVTVSAEYAGYVEEGTEGRRAQPYLGPAADAVAPGFEQAVNAALSRLGVRR